MKVKKLTLFQILSGILLIALVISIGFNSKCNITGFAVSEQQTVNNVVSFINEKLLQGNAQAKLVKYSETSGVINVTLDVNGQNANIFTTKDGRYIFLGSIDTKTYKAPSANTGTEEEGVSCSDIPKKDTPELEAFVVSYCPFGLQMQRVLTKLPKELKEYVKVRYIGEVNDDGTGIVSMHGDKEAIENLRQICIREEQSDKYWDYIECFIKDANSTRCLNEVNVDQDALNGCMNDPKRGIEYAKVDFEKEKEYGVSGSPTLIINGMKISEFEFASSLGLSAQNARSPEVIKSIICCGMDTQIDACNGNLTTTSATTGISPNYSGSSGSGSC